jgi:AcrR family transcriptional regulator
MGTVQEMSEPSKRVQSRSLEKRRRIVDAAAKILAKRGYAQATLTEIAKTAGAQAANIFYYFDSREDLVRDVLLTALDRMQVRMVQAVEEAGEAATHLERLRHVMRAVLMHLMSREDQYGRAYLRSFNQVPDSLVHDMDVKRHETRQLWFQLISAAQEAGEIPRDVDVNLATHLVLGATNWVSVWYRPNGPQPRAEIADRFIAMLEAALTGVGAQKNGP